MWALGKMAEDKVSTILRIATDSRYLEAERLLIEMKEKLFPIDMSSLLQEEMTKQHLVTKEAHKPILHATDQPYEVKEILHRAGEIKQTLNWERELEGFRETLSVKWAQVIWDRYLL